MAVVESKKRKAKDKICSKSKKAKIDGAMPGDQTARDNVPDPTKGPKTIQLDINFDLVKALSKTVCIYPIIDKRQTGM